MSYADIAAQNKAAFGPSGEHEHKWGPVAHAAFTGNPHRKCTVSGCTWITLDLRDDDDPSEGACEMHIEAIDAALDALATDPDVHEGDYFLALNDIAFRITQAQKNTRSNRKGTK